MTTLPPGTPARAAAPTWRGPLGFAAVAGVLLVTFGGLLGAFDLESMLGAGHAVLAGRTPYASVGSAVFQAGHAFVYPYVVAWLFAPLAALPHLLAVGLWVACSGAALVAGCRLLGHRGWLAPSLLLSCSTTVVGLQMGTVNAGLFLGAALAWSARRRAATAGVAVAAVAVAKLFLIPLIAWLVLARRLRAAVVAAGLLVLALGSGWAAGPLGYHAYSAMLDALQTREAPGSWSLTAFLESLRLPAGVATPAAVVVAGGVLVAGAVWARRHHDERALFAAAVIASLLATPILWSSYLLLLAAVVLVGAADNRPVAVLALGSWVLVTPDVASPARVAVGVALSAALAALAFSRAARATTRSPAPSATRSDPPGPRRPMPRPRVAPATLGWLTAAAALVATLAWLPTGVRSAVPALLTVTAAGAALARTVRVGHRPARADAPHP